MPIAIITGASRGFGRALAIDLAKDGWGLVIDGRRPTNSQKPISSPAHRSEPMVRAIPGDITSARHRAASSTPPDDLGGVDLLVNNASTLGPSPLRSSGASFTTRGSAARLRSQRLCTACPPAGSPCRHFAAQKARSLP